MTRPPSNPRERPAPAIDEREVKARVGEILNRHPAIGLAVGVVCDGRLEFFDGHGLADIASNTSVTEDTVFRIASLTKTFTAIAVTQLWEKGLLDLDAPANDYLRAYRLVPANPSDQPATVRHLLTHTAGIPEVVHVSDLLHPDWGPFDARPAVHSVKIGERLPTLAEYYRGGLRLAVEPGTAFAYSNHGFATLGQIVEDVSGMPLERYFREHIFEPLGMTDTDLVRSKRVESRLATGYDVGGGAATAVTDRDWVGRGAGGIYSSSRDMARYLAALLGGGVNEHGSVLKPASLATMFEPHYQPDPRLPGIGLGFFRGTAGRHRLVEHDGILPGFSSHLLVAPDDGVGVIGFTNGSRGAFTWLPMELGRLLCHLLHVPDEVVRCDVLHRPEIWEDLCGRYQLPARISDLRVRAIMGGGAQVFVRGGRLMVRVLTPIPALYQGFPLHPDDIEDPYVFRLDLSKFGMSTARVVFRRGTTLGTTTAYAELGSQPLSLAKRPAANGSRLRVTGALAALGVATAAIAVGRRRRRALTNRRAGGVGQSP
jgi:CubicO group peptidase (beta-lactamase class C family)